MFTYVPAFRAVWNKAISAQKVMRGDMKRAIKWSCQSCWRGKLIGLKIAWVLYSGRFSLKSKSTSHFHERDWSETKSLCYCENRFGFRILTSFAKVTWLYITSLLVLMRKRLQSVLGGGDSSVVRAPNSWLKGRGFETLLGRRENFVLQCQLFVLTLILVSVPPPCYSSST